jgi:hypothetical protein
MTWRRDSSGASLASGGTTFDTSFNTNTQIKAAGGKNDTFASYPASSAPQQKVRFNGASMVLESVPAPAPVRGTVTGASGDALPPAPPKVSVSTASGARLLPPPRVAAARIDAEAGEGLLAVETTDAQAAGETEQKTSADQEARDDLQGLLRALQSARLEESSAPRSVEETSAEATVGTFQMSDDGAAMLFSTG